MATSSESMKLIEVFISYSHKDERLRIELEKRLSVLKRQGVITEWHDRKISAGTEWAGKIDNHLNTAHVILLLISPDFIASDYCHDIEMKQAMEQHNSSKARVIPIVLRPCDWQGTLFAKLQILPTDARPVTKWPNRDDAFLNVAQGIRAAVEELKVKLTIVQPSSYTETPPIPSVNKNPNETKQQLVMDETEAFERLVERSMKYIKVDKGGNVVFLTPRAKLTDRQAVALALLGRYFATELHFAESEIMTTDEVQRIVEADKTVVASRLNELKKEGVIDSPERAKFKINWLKASKILDELE